MNRRVVVTGVGLITPLGTGNEESWQTLRDGRSMIRAVDYLDPAEFKSRIAASIQHFGPLNNKLKI
jgi:3-oxoacyl-[acyl-carrier-protein] synthase II